MPLSGTYDFTLKKYQELCQILVNSGYIPLTLREYLEKKKVNDDKIVVLRHDVDRNILNALSMAEQENEMGISSTYYFRYPYTFQPKVLNKIYNLDHEIGYHYEVLAKAKGHPEKAIQLFERELTTMKEIGDIRTICMHGSPFSRYDNRDLWYYYDFCNYGIIGDAYISMVGKGLQYFTDTGRSWSGRHSIRDFIPNDNMDKNQIESTDNLINWIQSSMPKGIYLTVHPERWAVHAGDWAIGSLKDAIANIVKVILFPRILHEFK